MNLVIAFKRKQKCFFQVSAVDQILYWFILEMLYGLVLIWAQPHLMPFSTRQQVLILNVVTPSGQGRGLGPP